MDRNHLMKNLSHTVGSLLVAAISCFAPVIANAAIVGGPLTNPANNHVYFLLSSNTWTGAEAEAQTLGGHLTTINDAAEQAWVFTTFGNLGGTSRYLWIGLNDVQQEGVFAWVDGATNTYRNWKPGEPNALATNEDYAVILSPSDSSPGMWSDAQNVSNFGAPGLDAYGVVEINPVVPRIVGGPLTNPANGHVYYLLSSNTWTGAEAEAQALGGHLATINDAAEQAWVFTNFASLSGTPRHYWIGLNDTATEGTFAWANSESASYFNWAPGEPNNGNAGEDYVFVLKPGVANAGKWNDYRDDINTGIATDTIFAVAEVVLPTYNLSGDFSLASNPNGVWSYGWKSNLTGALNLHGFTKVTTDQLGATVNFWSKFQNDDSSIGKNLSAGGCCSGQVQHAQGAIFMNPGHNGAVDNFSVARFTVPTGGDGVYQIVALAETDWNGPQGGDTDFHIIRGASSVFDQFIPASTNVGVANRAGVTNTLTLTAGETIDFAVGRGADGIYDFSLTEVSVTLIKVSEIAPPPCTPSSTGLVSWWRGEGNALDAVGGNNGQLQGGATFIPGKVGQGFSFTAAADGVRVPASSNINVGPGPGLTFEAWINPADFTNRLYMAEWNNGAGGVGAQFQVLTAAEFGLGAGNIWVNLSDTAGNDHNIGAPGGTLVTNQYQHFAATYDRATGLAKIYRNGAVVASQNLGIFTPQTTYDFYIGRRVSGGANFSFRGSIDDPSLYSRALTDSEVLAIYNAGAGGKCSSPVPPMISAHPQSTNAPTGGNAAFNVQAIGSAPLAFQWHFNSNDLAGATNASLILTNVQLSQAGDYSVTVSNPYGTTNSSKAILSVTSQPCTPPPSGLVGWWKAEGDTSDTAGTNNGQLQGGATFVSGRVGQAFGFTVDTDGVRIPASSNLNVGPGPGLTFEAWINPADFTNRLYMAEWNNGSGGLGAQFSVLTAGEFGLGAGNIWVNLKDTGGNDHNLGAPGGTLVTNQFQHFAATYDRTTGLAKIYRNGVVVSSQNLGIFTPQTTYDFYVGRRVSGGANFSFRGSIDEPSLYNRALTDAEVLAIYSAAASGKCSSPVPPSITQQPFPVTTVIGGSAYFSVLASGSPTLNYQWHFGSNEISGATNNSLTLSNVQLFHAGNYSVTVSNSVGTTNSSAVLLSVTTPTCITPPTGLVSWWRGEGVLGDETGGNPASFVGNLGYTAGKVGQAFVFNGSNTALRIPAHSNLNIGSTGNLTMEGWINPSDVSGYHPIWEWNDATNKVGVHVWIGRLTSDVGVLFANLVDANGTSHTIFSPSGTLVTNSFQHIALTYDQGTGVAILYRNGAVVAQSTLGSFTPQTAYDFWMGDRPTDHVGDSSYDRHFAGLIDEVSLYNRALTAGEIQAAYAADTEGKCVPASIPAAILTHPTSQSVLAGAVATFNVQAIGSAPLSYQWHFNSNDLAGATNASLILTNVQLSQAGDYSVTVSNPYGTTNSAIATLNVTLPPALVSLVASTGEAGGIVSVPVRLRANGNENTLGFSVSFATNRLTLESVELGLNAAGAQLNINSNSASSGRVGILLALPFGTSFPQGTQEVVRVNFNVAPVTTGQTTALSFTDTPIARQLVSPAATILSATYSNASVTITNVGFEGDVSPRAGVDKAVTAVDWVQVGRFVAGLDTISNSAEFQRADCAPRASKGDGRLKLTDWVQAGRYASGADPLTSTGGPTSGPGPGAAPASKAATLVSGRTLRMANAILAAGQNSSISVQLDAQGNENAASASISYNAAVMQLTSVTLGSDAAGGLLIVNSNTAGKVAFILALPSSQTFAAGTRQVVNLNFSVVAEATGVTPISFDNTPVPSQLSDALANDLASSYEDGLLTLDGPPPKLRIDPATGGALLSWPITAPGYLLESVTDWTPTNAWSNVPTPPSIIGTQQQVTVPVDPPLRIFRLKLP